MKHIHKHSVSVFDLDQKRLPQITEDFLLASIQVPKNKKAVMDYTYGGPTFYCDYAYCDEEANVKISFYYTLEPIDSQ